MSNAKNIEKMETRNTQNVENQSINNIKIMKNLSLTTEHIETLKKCLEKQMEIIDRKIDLKNNVIRQTIYCEQKFNFYRKTILLRDKLQNQFNQLESVWIKLH